ENRANLILNCTQTVEFSLMGFAGNLELQLTLFMAFLVVYLMTLLGNLGMIILIRTSPQLHSPMYYFLGNLALVDFLYSTVVTPKLLADLVRQKPLSYVGCVTQVFVFGVFLVTECFLLATMAYDRYMAVSHPLHYSVLMSPRLCVQLVGGSYLAGLVNELLFMIFLLIYITTLVGNLGMIVLIRTDPQLHTSMYFFLSHLSFLDICYSSSVTPKLLSGLLTGRNVISFNGCITQFFFCMVFITTDAIFLAIMAYDRYVAIRQPLHYVVVMSHRVRMRLVVGSYTAGGLNALVHTTGLLRLSFCGPNVVNHFYCEIPPLLPLSCSETRLNEVVMVLCATFIITTTGLAILTTTGLAILTSYAFILLTVWSTRSAEGRHKACSTCTSHLMAVALFYSSAAFLYLHPLSSHAEEERKTASVFYTVVVPMLNPFIYSLRNMKVRIALRRKHFHCL
uniref:G-protein coupled receptors family 1 profile domain-containing protein n=1 Tax=Cairina moschata TaxID=8855 RepID=A0A8C3GGF4_CAIMO